MRPVEGMQLLYSCALQIVFWAEFHHNSNANSPSLQQGYKIILMYIQLYLVTILIYIFNKDRWQS